MSSSDSEHASLKPSKRRRAVISDSESSDGSIIKTHRRRRVYRVTSDNETSEDDSDVPKPVIRRTNCRVVSEDDTSFESSSETESDGSNDLVISDSDSSGSNSDWRSTDESTMDQDAGRERTAKLSKGLKKPKNETPEKEHQPPPIDGDSDSSDSQGEKCPICLLTFKKQEIANPESCDHSFCLDCLLEWSKNINTCPVDRQTFALILVRKNLGGKVVRQLPVAIRPPIEEQIQEDATYCEICQQCDREDRMLLCDGCDLGYHLECLTPPMTEVPMDEWFCPECSRNIQDDAEVVEIDLDELPDLMEEARRLGESYGRTRTGRDREVSLGPRVIPRTRQTERVRANIRADRDRNRSVIVSHENGENNTGAYFDPDQPSTSSSGMDSTVSLPTVTNLRSLEIERRSRRNGSRITSELLGSNSSSAPKKKKTKVTRKSKKRTKKKTSTRKRSSIGSRKSSTRLREVTITEINDNGEEEEIVTYVRVKDTATKRNRRTYKRKRTKNTRKTRRNRRARTVRSQAAKVATVKKRLALALGISKPNRSVPLLIPTVKNRTTTSVRGVLSSSRYNAGISQVNLFGNSHDLNYSPTGSDTESESCLYGGSNGHGLLVSSRPRNATSSTRRHASLKTISNPLISRDLERSGTPTLEGMGTTNAADLINGILNSQEFWHSKKKSEVTLKADGTFLITKNNNNNTNDNDNNINKHSINNNESPIKEKKNIIIDNIDEENNIPSNENRLDLNNVSQNDIVQNPMYNNPRGGGGNRGNFRGGNNYNCENNRHSYGGGQYGGGRESYGGGGGRHSYGGPGSRDGYNNDRRDFGPPINYNQSFETRGPHPGFINNQQFRNRNPQQNFRNERPPPRFPPPLLADRNERQQQQQHSFPHQDNNAFPNPNSFQRFRPPLHLHPLIPGPRVPLHTTNLSQPFQDEGRDTAQVFHPHNEVREQIPFPQVNLNEPGNSRNQLIDEEECDLYSDIEPPVNKNSAGDEPADNEDANGGGAVVLPPPPEPPSGLLDFEESKSDRDCNDSDQELVIDDTPKEETKAMRSDDKYDPFAADSDSNDGQHAATASQSFNTINYEQEHTISKPPVRLTAYDDDDDDDSQADCPNFSIYSSQTMDVARNSEQELSQQIGPLEPPPLPPDIPDDDDIIVGDIQACDLADIPEPSDPYVESLQKERQTLSKIPPKKISNDSRGKITFKIGNKLKLSNKLSNLYDEIDETIESSIQHDKEVEEKRNKNNEEKKSEEMKKEVEKAQNKSEEDEEEEKLAELEKELKEKEQKLREMEQLEELAKLDMEGDTEENKNDTENSDSKKTENAYVKDDSNCPKDKNKIMSTIDLTEKSSDSIISIADTVHSSPKNPDGRESNIKTFGNRKEKDRDKDNTSTGGWKKVETIEDKDVVIDQGQVLYDKIDEFMSRKQNDDEDDDDDAKSEKDDKITLDDEEKDDSTPREENDQEDVAIMTDKLEVENFPLEKDPTEIFEGTIMSTGVQDQNWESDGGYTPCKDELPIMKTVATKDTERRGSLSPFESGLEPITPTKDKSNDDLDGCRTPAGYAGLGTEAISETDEPMSFEEEATAQMNLRKDKEMEDGEIMDDGRLSRKTSEKPSNKEKEDENKRKKKKEKKEKGKESDKNKENISSQNQVAWKKISKNTKERQYRDKDRRSKSREKDKENQKDSKDKDKDRERDKDKDKSKKKGGSGNKDVARKKEKRKELERYDVRKIVADKPSRPRKDEYGRDIREESRSRSRSASISRRRSLSRDRRSRSYSRNRSRSRSRSRLRRSWSRDRGSYSKGGGRSISRRRSLSRSRRKVSRRRSASRKRSVSRKRSLSKRRSRSPSRKRKSSLSPRRRSSRGRSRSRSRDKKKEKLKKQHKSRSRSRNRKRSRTKTPTKRVASRSRDKKHVKRKQHASSRSRERSRERSRSREQRERNKNWEAVNEKPADRERHASSRDRRSWSAQWTPSWSRSRSRTLTPARHDDVASHGGWSPPAVLDNVAVPPKNLTVILTNKEAIKKQKKKEKKKDPKKLKELEKRKKNKRNRTPPPSKEVFASGDNILVSVCFNKENETNPTELPDVPEAPPLVTPAVKRSRRRETVQSIEPIVKRSKKEKVKEKRPPKSPKNKKEKKKKSKAAEIAATKKPVAVIDLDQSPFREQTPSPRDVIVLSDDEDHKETQEIATPEQHNTPRASPQHEQFVSQGPKTPPEPQIKFSINKQQSNLRTSMINPLHEEEEEEIDERADEELEMRAQEELELRLKIGPNTPPEPPTSPPTSPDAYDPFDPTKSRSPTPAASQEATPADERDRNQCSSPRNHDGDDNNSCTQNIEGDNKQNSMQGEQNQGNEKQIDKPKIISMVTIKRASPKRESSPNIVDGVNQSSEIGNQTTNNDSPNKNQQGILQQTQQNQQGNFSNVNPVLATVTAAVQRSGTLFNTSTPISAQRNLVQPNRISPINQSKQRSSERPHLPNLFANPGKATTPSRSNKSSASAQSKNASAMGQNGGDAGMETTNDTLDMSSPYSPGSSLSDGIFDPPSPGGGHSPQQSNTQQNTSKNTPSKTTGSKNTEKKDAFDVLFGSSPAVKNIGKNRGIVAAARKIPDKDKRKKSTNPKVGVRMDENQLQILDDLPSSAVEMQVKDKFLKKLNRQERVVEEVKLVLKPHYTKKHVTKEEYKDIMRKAVPKICHNKTGEINPKKIGQLVEAYVKKCRINKKKGGGAANVAKGQKAAKNLWS